MKINRYILGVSVVWAHLLVVTHASAQCKPGDPVGRFEGSATSAQAGKLEISLNLLCANGHYAGTLNSPIGLYQVIGGSFGAGSLKLQFALNNDTIAIETKVSGDSIHGTFVSVDDKGPVELHRTGEAMPVTASQDNLSLTPQQWRQDLAYFAEELPKRHPDAFVHAQRQV